MRILTAFMAVALLSTSALAEVLTAIDTPKGAVTPLSKDASIWVKCFGCDVMKERVLQRLKEAGYAIVAKPADASTKVVIAA
ncbi:hypothetical protein [Pelomicrobium sp.]|jgi:hypothetical protein|uniref:hypothetical protein n=1 Tax=Pelomicrobium sp. TaxID=2815319 RepID=UPI002FDCF536